MNAEQVRAAIESAQYYLAAAIGQLESLQENFPKSTLMTSAEDRLYDEIEREKRQLLLTDDRLGDINKNVFERLFFRE